MIMKNLRLHGTYFPAPDSRLFLGMKLHNHKFERGHPLVYYEIYILCTVNTQHTSRQDAVNTTRLYLATCFGRKRPSSGELRTILRYSKNITQWDRISFTLM